MRGKFQGDFHVKTCSIILSMITQILA